MNMSIDLACEDSRPIGKLKRAANKRGSNPKSFAELAAEYRAAYIIYNDTGLHLDEEVAKKYYDKTDDIEKKMTKPDLPMNRFDEVTLVKIIANLIEGENSSFEEAFAHTSCGPFVIKLLNNIAASGSVKPRKTKKQTA